MITELPGNLGEILPLRLRLREPLSFASQQGLLLANRGRDGQTFLLKHWQYEILSKMDGRRTFGELAEETLQQFPNRFSSDGLLNFYSWLYHENLVTVASVSIFEFDTEGESGFDRAEARTAHPQEPTMPKRHRTGEMSRWKTRMNWRAVFQVAALLIFTLCVLRIGLVMAPALTPAATRLVAKWKGSAAGQAAPLVAEMERVLPQAEIVERELASKAVAEIPLPPTPESSKQEVAEPKALVPESATPDPVRLDSLRKELAACRIRRDEFYIQEDEAGYRREVERMAAIVRELGEIETGR